MKQHYAYNERRSAPANSWWATLVALVLLLTGQASAQTYTMPNTGSTAVTTCTGTLYDNGGATGTYSANANGTVTITPATPGSKVRLQFSSFAVSYYDRLTIYDGSSTSAPVIGTYYDYYTPGTVYATTSAGTLTVRFATDYYSTNYSGFAADIACVTTVPQPDLSIQGSSVSPISAVPGTILSLYSSIYNLSGTAATSSNIGYYLSTDATLSSNDILLGNSTGANLAVGNYSSRSSSVQVPANTTAGGYYVLFVADYQNVVSESNEQNNVSSVSLNVVPPTIDLVIQQPNASPTTTAPGNVLGLSCTITNQGNALAAYSSVGYYLSSNTTLDNSDQLLTSSYGGQLAANSPSYRSVTTNVPPGTAPGTYYVLFAADYQNLVTESNETNNVAAATITVAAPNVDLIVSQANLSVYSMSAGTTVNAGATVSNQGNIASSSSNMSYYISTDATFSSNDVLLNSTTGGALSAGTSNYPSTTLTIPAIAPAGNYFVLFVVDPQNQVTESNEQNNVRSVGITVVAPSIDLVIQSAALNSTSTTAGTSISGVHYIYNQGNTTAASSNAGYYLSSNTTLDANDVFLSSTTGGALTAGNYVTRYPSFVIPATTAAGTYYVLFVADYEGAVAETNENNNVSATTLNVIAAGVDLVVESAVLNTTATTAGNTISGNHYIYNQGTSTAASSNVGYYLSSNTTLDGSDVFLTSTTGGALTAGNYVMRYPNFTIPANTPTGNYYVLFVADYQNSVSETVETNNTRAVGLYVGAAFSGVVVPFSGSATVTTCGTTIADHAGNGTYADNANGSLTIYPSTAGSKVRLTFTSFALETCCDQVTIYDGPNTNSPLIGSYVYSPGVVTAQNSSGALTVVFRTDGSVVETGFEATVSCVTSSTSLSDLLVQNPVQSATSVAAGGSISMGGTVRNQGAGEASSSLLGYYLSLNTTLDGGDLLLGTSSGGALAAGASSQRGASYNIPSGISPGTYYIVYAVDPNNSVAETNETNNTASLPLTVVAALPDLAVSNATVNPTSVLAGATVSASCLLSNIGTSPSPQSSVSFYLSTDNTLSNNDLAMSIVTAATMPANTSVTRSASFAIPAATAPGTYYILYVADAAGVMYESNEQNNVVSQAFTVLMATPVREQLNGFTLNVYPNPATGGEFSVSMDGPSTGKVAQMVLFNSVGQQVSIQSLPLTSGRGSVRFATRNLGSGVYTLRITGEDLNVTRRIVIE